MVAIHLDELFGHFNDSNRAVTIVSLGHKSIPFRHFHAVKQLARYFLHQGFVVFAIGLARCQSKVERLAHTTAFQLGFEAGDQITGTVQIHQRLFTDSGVDDFTMFVSDCVFQRNHAQGSYFHVRDPADRKKRAQNTSKRWPSIWSDPLRHDEKVITAKRDEPDLRPFSGTADNLTRDETPL